MNTPSNGSAGASVMVPLERIPLDAGAQTRVKVREPDAARWVIRWLAVCGRAHLSVTDSSHKGIVES